MYIYVYSCATSDVRCGHRSVCISDNPSMCMYLYMNMHVCMRTFACTDRDSGAQATL